MLVENGVNYANNPCYELWSKQASYNPDVNVNIAGVAFLFEVPERMIGKTMMLHIGANVEVITMDMFLTGAIYGTFNDVLGNTVNKISDTRCRLLRNYSYWNIPIVISDTSVAVAMAYVNSQGIARSKTMTLNFIYLNEDNKINIPVKWNEATI